MTKGSIDYRNYMKLPLIPATVFDFCEANLKPNETIIVGVSGGPDSTALLSALSLYAKKYPLTVIVAHVNHGIRKIAASGDEAFVKKLAQQCNFKFVVKRVVLKGSGLEEQGRKVRRKFFEQLAKKYGASAICTAHTKDDQLETILFNMIRGAYIGGMAGMRPVEQQRNSPVAYMKPFLAVTKKEILAYLKKNKIKFCHDEMNDDTTYTRVYLRKKIIPLLQKINPSIAQTVSKNALLFQQLEDTLNL